MFGCSAGIEMVGIPEGGAVLPCLPLKVADIEPSLHSTIQIRCMYLAKQFVPGPNIQLP